MLGVNKNTVLRALHILRRKGCWSSGAGAASPWSARPSAAPCSPGSKSSSNSRATTALTAGETAQAMSAPSGNWRDLGIRGRTSQGRASRRDLAESGSPAEQPAATLAARRGSRPGSYSSVMPTGPVSPKIP